MKKNNLSILLMLAHLILHSQTFPQIPFVYAQRDFRVTPNFYIGKQDTVQKLFELLDIGPKKGTTTHYFVEMSDAKSSLEAVLPDKSILENTPLWIRVDSNRSQCLPEFKPMTEQAIVFCHSFVRRSIPFYAVVTKELLESEMYYVFSILQYQNGQYECKLSCPLYDYGTFKMCILDFTYKEIPVLLFDYTAYSGGKLLLITAN